MEKKSKKRVLILVHGATPFRFKNHFLNSIQIKVLQYLSSDKKGITMKDYHALANYLQEHYDQIEILRWDGKIPLRAKNIPESKALVKLLKKHGGGDIDVIAVSLGGYVAERGIAESNIKINKLLYIGAVHNSHHTLKNVKKVINVYSLADKMFYVANDLYEGIGNFILKGENVANIALEKIGHSNLGRNVLIADKKFREKYLYELYKRLLFARNE